MQTRLWKVLLALSASLLLAVSCTNAADSPNENPGSADTVTETPSNQLLPSAEVNELNLDRTEYRSATLRDVEFKAAEPACEGASNGELRIGGLLPQTGQLAYLGPVQQAATNLALDDITRAGGVAGLEVAYSLGNSGLGETSLVTARRFIEQEVDVIIGPPSSALSKRVTAEITGACRIQISAANTAVGFDKIESNELYFRTSPSDQLQGQALADLITQSGASKVAVIAERGEYGLPLAALTLRALERTGIETERNLYDSENVEFNAIADATTKFAPDAIALIGFEESGQIIAELLRRGLRTQQIYLSDGNAGDALGEQFESQPNELDGIRGIQPGADVPDSFRQRLAREDSAITDFSFGPETYDAIIVIALAAELARTDSAPEVARQINDVTRDGARCTSFSQCKSLIAAGETNIDYDGISGPLSFGATGEPTTATFAVVEFG